MQVDLAAHQCACLCALIEGCTLAYCKDARCSAMLCTSVHACACCFTFWAKKAPSSSAMCHCPLSPLCILCSAPVCMLVHVASLPKLHVGAVWVLSTAASPFSCSEALCYLTTR
eukprot:380636-Pelagomonas_calceolata.AAC.4